MMQFPIGPALKGPQSGDVPQEGLVFNETLPSSSDPDQNDESDSHDNYGRYSPSGQIMAGYPDSLLPLAADLYCDIEPPPRFAYLAYGPGLSLVASVTLAAAYLNNHYGAPLTLMALLIGLALNFLNSDRRLGPGLRFASRTLLRLGIVLIGARATLGQIAALGPQAFVALVAIAVLTLLSAVVTARLLRVDAAFGVLAGAATAICGASAALAVATVMGEKRLGQAALPRLLVSIAAMSALAMLLYPMIAHMLHLNDRQAGFVFGSSIHDVAQALGAGYAYSNSAGASASIVKLARVAMLGPLLAVLALSFGGEGGKSTLRRIVPPAFVIGFFLLACVNSIGLVPQVVAEAANMIGGFCLAGAVAATGISAPLDQLRHGSGTTILIVGVATGVALLLSLSIAITIIS